MILNDPTSVESAPEVEIFVVHLEMNHNIKISYKQIQKSIQEAVNLIPGVLFKSIHLIQEPDPYDLTNPDKPPRDWK